MRICFTQLIHPNDSVAGGGQVVTGEWAERLVRRGHAVWVINPASDRPSISWRPGYRVVTTRRPHRHHVVETSLRLALAVARLNSRQPLDLVHATGAEAALLTCLPRAWQPAPLLMTSHMPYLTFHPLCGPLVRTALRNAYICRLIYLERIGARRARRVVAVSRSSARLVEERFGVPAERVRLVYNGVDEQRFRPPPREPHSPSVVFIGRLTVQKGLDTLLRALAVVRVSHPDVRLLVVGDGSGRGEYEALAARLGVAEALEWLGQVEPGEVPGLMQRAQVVALPSRTESFGLTVAEALCCGRATVASTAGAIPEIIEPGVSGLLVPPDDVPSLAEALWQLLSDPERRRQLGAAGRQRIVEHFTWDRSVTALTKVYGELVPGEW